MTPICHPADLAGFPSFSLPLFPCPSGVSESRTSLDQAEGCWGEIAVGEGFCKPLACRRGIPATWPNRGSEIYPHIGHALHFRLNLLMHPDVVSCAPRIRILEDHNLPRNNIACTFIHIIRVSVYIQY